MISVKATKLGYYDLKRREAGTVFQIQSDKHFSSSWMAKVGSKKEEEFDQDALDHDGLLSDDEPMQMAKRPVRVKQAQKAKALKSTGDTEVI